jgi:hypothetical protein
MPAHPIIHDLEQERKAVRALVERRGLVAVLNDTKWRELCMAMYTRTEKSPRFQILDLLGKEPAAWNGEWYHYPYPYFSIEWMDIDPKGQIDDVLAILKRFSIPYSRNGEFLRVWGYYSPACTPQFEARASSSGY